MRQIPYSVVNVFSGGPFSGNAIAVFPEITDLHETEMQQLARELNLRCSVFIDRAKDGESLARLRFFTPSMERMFSGKGTLAAWKPFFEREGFDLPVAAADGLLSQRGDLLSFKSQSWDKTTEVSVEFVKGKVESISVLIPDAEMGEEISDLAAIAEALGLSEEVLRSAGLTPRIVKAGGAKLFVALPADDDLQKISLSSLAMERRFSRLNIEGIYAFSLDSVRAERPIRGRGFYPSTGVEEDSASGSAVAGLIAYLMENDVITCRNKCMIRVCQGLEEQKGSLINAQANCGESRRSVTISGDVYLSRTGLITLP